MKQFLVNIFKLNRSLKFLYKLRLNIYSILNIHPANEIRALINKLRPISCDKTLIRLGPKGDGGYLVPDDLEGIVACFSPGVGSTSKFEKDCAERGMKIFMADNSVAKAAESHELFHFTKKHLGATTSDDYITIDDWVAASLPASQDDLLLQMDIEGGEYEVFSSMSNQLLKRFRIIVVEFHGLERFWHRPFFNQSSRIFDKLLQTHSCVHIHPNNCTGASRAIDIKIFPATEFTFLRNDRIKNRSYASTFPHPLDDDNVENMPSVHLPKCWYQ